VCKCIVMHCLCLCCTSWGDSRAHCCGFEVFKYPSTAYAFMLSFDTTDGGVSYSVMFCAKLIVSLGATEMVI
jgi:hypothetical protein